LIAEFKGFENNISVEDIMPIAKMTIDEYLADKYSQVIVIYSHFASSIKQVSVVQKLLPISSEHIDNPNVWTPTEENTDVEYKFEPSLEAVIDGILKQILRVQIFGAILEANASEHSARMIAMKNSTDNATSLIDDLTLIYNSVRQSNITTEISEISAAAEAMK
jgi:F-type H+-transporting ATPase subunit gamma